MRVRVLWILATVCLLTTLVCVPVYAKSAALKTLTLPELINVIKSHKGKVVVINFFATWCPPCKEEIPGLVALHKDFSVDKLAVIGLSVDQDKGLVPPFIEQQKIGYPVYMVTPDVAQSYNVHTIPHNAIYDTKGDLAANVTGFVSEKDLKDFINTLLEQKAK